MRRNFWLLITAFCGLLCFDASAQADTARYGQRMAATVMTLWKDSLVFDRSRNAVWSYDQGVIYNGLTGLWKQTGNGDYFKYIKARIDKYISADGTTIRTYKKEDYNLDNIKNGDALLMLYRVTGEEKYWKAASLLYSQLKSHPRTQEGGFWHKKVYQHQMWLDGLYMAEPFYATYAEMTHNAADFKDVANQFILIEKHTRDAATGLLYHGWDESKEQRWANKQTGNSPNFWARAMGWYGMALVDALEHFPDNDPNKKQLIAILNRYATAVVKVQDTKNGLWWDVMNFPGRKGNYYEASAACMFAYTMAKGVRLGYLPRTYTAPALKAYKGICKEFLATEANELQTLKGTVSVSGLGGNPYRDASFEYYISEKVVDNDLKGVGAFIQMCNEVDLLKAMPVGKPVNVLLDGYFNHETRKNRITGETEQYHYVWDEDDNNGFSSLKTILTGLGASTSFTTSAPNASTLSKADVYIIVDPDTEKESPVPNYLQDADIKSIYNWVQQGGVLLLLGNDKDNAEFEHFNRLAGKFGITFNNDSRNRVTGLQFEMGTLNIPPGHAIFPHVKQVYIKELATLSIKSPARSAFSDNGDIIMAVAKMGKGTVFAVGDPWLYNEYVDGRKLPANLQNYTSAQDLMRWLIRNSKSAKKK